MAARPDLSSTRSKDYNDLLQGRIKPTYVANLYRFDPGTKYTDLFRGLLGHVDRVIDEVERKSGRKIAAFTLGQSCAKHLKASKHKQRNFDSFNFGTWDKNGWNRKWMSYQKDGYDGMIVVCAVTREVTSKLKAEWLDQIQYSKALEQSLIAHYVLVKNDERIANDSFIVRPEANGIGGAIYIAYKLGTNDETASMSKGLDSHKPVKGKGDNASRKITAAKYESSEEESNEDDESSVDEWDAEDRKE